MEIGRGIWSAYGKDTDTQLLGCFHLLLESSGDTALFRQDGIWMKLPHQVQLIGFAVQQVLGISHLIETEMIIRDAMSVGYVQRTLAL